MNDTMTNGLNGYGGIGFLALILLFYFFNRNNEVPNGYCQDMSTQCASAVATQTQLESAIRTETELGAQNVLILNQNEATRNKLDNFRAEFKQDQIDQLRFAQAKSDTENAILRQQLFNQNQFNELSRQIASVDCNCLKKPPFWPVGCTPCPATSCSVA